MEIVAYTDFKAWLQEQPMDRAFGLWRENNAVATWLKETHPGVTGVNTFTSHSWLSARTKDDVQYDQSLILFISVYDRWYEKANSACMGITRKTLDRLVKTADRYISLLAATEAKFP